MYKIIADQVTGRRGKSARKGNIVSGEMFTEETLKKLIENKAIEAFPEKESKKPEIKK